MKPRHKLTSFARELRNNPTDVERLLWQHLRNSQLEGIKFRRQQTIEDYIVDFVSFSPRLAIELDGGQHALNRERDQHRDECLRKNGFAVLRFWNNEVIENIWGVLEVIRHQCLGEVSPGCSHPHPPTPSREGRGSETLDGYDDLVKKANRPASREGRGSETLDGVGAEDSSSLDGDRRTNSPSLDGRGLGGG